MFEIKDRSRSLPQMGARVQFESPQGARQLSCTPAPILGDANGRGSQGDVVIRSVFISYRRGPTAPWAGRLADRFKAHLGDGVVFLDVDSIPAGAEFAATIDDRLRSVDATIVLIGPDWLGADAAAGTRRIDDPDDFVRREVASSLELGHRVIPVLVDRATMPSRSELPAELAALSSRNAVTITHDGFEPTIQRLLDQSSPATPATVRRPSFAVMAAVGGALVAGVIIAALSLAPGGRDETSRSTLEEPSTTPVVTTDVATTTPVVTTAVATTIDSTPGAVAGFVTLFSSTGRTLTDVDAFTGMLQIDVTPLNVTPLDADAGQCDCTLVDESGGFRVDGLQPGRTYELVASSEGFHTTTTTFDIEAGRTTRVNTSMTALGGSLTGRVVNSSGDRVGRVDVNVRSDYGGHRTATTPQSGVDVGVFRLEGLDAPALHTVDLTAVGFERSVTRVYIDVNQDRSLDFRLAES